MAKEIERKFLVKDDSWRQLAKGSLYRQGYISSQGATVRIRIVGNQGYLTIKGMTINYSRSEFEYPIPLADAQEMLDTLCVRPLIEKTRYKINLGSLVWEVDDFAGANQGLILAEVELTDEAQQIELPDWIGEEVSGDPKYYNSYLVKHPFCEWE
ncbi:CYTH domain-containing protein [Anabaena sp. UHCC 0399]|uniref:CYTH domain-containing protein n=1 Tax=Anabaena sp. UHCC 0399 TaxID=3110238 RepID=UPI002B1F3024|nr:CYTH domain-containing protein [Anabaena sp. UHCC 0399]MEA5568651.1 CYTH domain-containing protein [Anabaena sp. UHCC 0399]